MRDEEEKIARYVRRVIVVGLLLFVLCALIGFVLIRTDNYLGLFIFIDLFFIALLGYVYWLYWKLRR
jgi:heme A synthase